jgi:hypothetical protein
MILPFEAARAAERPFSVRLRLDQLLVLLLLPLIFAVRVVDVNYNTLFVDEAIYAIVGRDLLAGVADYSNLGWMYGSFLYPMMAGMVDSLGGVAGMRLLSATFSTLAAGFIYLATTRLFGGEAGVWATLIFGLTAISINTGQFAVYDAPVVPALAAALYCIVRAAEAPPRTERLLLLTAGFCLILAILAKYFAAIYLPVLCWVGIACALHQGRSMRPFLVWFLLPMAVVVGAYALIADDELRALLAGGFGVAPETRWLIFREFWAEIGVTTLIALGGLATLAWRGLPASAHAPRWRRRLWATLVPALAVVVLAAPIYHLTSANSQSAWKHSVYSLIFLAPLAGYACASLVGALRELPGRPGLTSRLIGALTSAVLIAWGVDYALDRNYGFQRSWPNVAGVVAHLQEAGLAPGDAVLAEGAQIYDYYFAFGPENSAMWTNTWYVRYADRADLEAMEAAIADRAYRYVVLDSYYTPAFHDRLNAALQAAGYTLNYEEPQTLSTGMNIRLQVYHAPEQS